MFFFNAGVPKYTFHITRLALLVFSAHVFAFDAPKASAKKPNIVLILADDLRWDALSIAGHPFFKSPNIDRIGNEGAVFRNAFVTHSLCSPSRATLLTGVYTHRHGVINNEVALNPNLPTVPKILQAAGYETAFIGKWHMGVAEAMPKPGFNRWVSFRGQGNYVDPEFNVDGKTQTVKGHMTDILTDFALEFLSQDRSVPFFMIVSHIAVHHPLIPQDRFAEKYATTNITFPPTYGENLSNKPEFVRCLSFRNDSLLTSRVRRYFDTLAGVDESVGKILNKLSEKGLLDETLVIFLGDNGHFLGEHNLVDKRAAYEESIRIPLLIRYPYWFRVNAVFPQLMALNLDIAPTVLEAAGIAAPPHMQGVSLRKLVRGEVKRQSFLYEYYVIPNNSCIPSMRAIRTQNHKYITYFDTTRTEELYDLTNDPIEVRNLIEDPAYAGVLKRLRFQLDSLRVATGDSTLATGVDDATEKTVREFSLYPNYPNPFNAGTTIKYTLPSPSYVSLKVFDVFGHEVETVVNEMQEAGPKSIFFDASNLASGIYFFRLFTPSFSATRKMMLMK
jgi:N-acetylglucosamine-6-sulfatase